MKLKRSPLAPNSFPQMPVVEGLKMWTAETGSKYKNRPDVYLVKFGKNARVAGVFTKSSAPGAPVDWSKKCLAAGATGGLLVNAGNANVFTGAAGVKGVSDLATMAAHTLSCAPSDIYVCSTGVVGEPLNTLPIRKALHGLKNTKICSWEMAARAISTTDTFPKGAFANANIDGTPIKICGIVKGSGMIMPDMATMLGFIYTDANIARDVLQTLLSEYCETSFNAITVDSDTSTSDTVLLISTAKAKHDEITALNDPYLLGFSKSLRAVMLDLAHQVIKDGEGVSKFITINVSGAKNARAAKTIAMSIANSPLVKTAIAGEDANWGRIVMAVGKSGVQVDRDRLAISFGPHLVAKNGLRADGYNENVMSKYMRGDSLEIHVDIGLGSGSFTVWTCDLTHGYIDINADYRS
ncbi:MAG: bifunctional glutamate N-acetyltransferase/amino-acid acetyltransferase ArgJ [Robiginitomaculum sp.]